MIEEKLRGILLNPVFSNFRSYLTLTALVGTSIMGCSGGSNSPEPVSEKGDTITWGSGFSQDTNHADVYSSPKGETSQEGLYCYKDKDGDKVGNSESGILYATGECPTGYSPKNGDCDDDNPDIHENCPQSDAIASSSDADVSTSIDTLTDTYTGKKIVEITAGYYHACARTSTNEVYCWGLNDKGQVSGTNAEEHYPVKVNGLTGYTITQLSAGARHTCAIADNITTSEKGVVLCWGDNDVGQGGYGSFNANIPTIVKGLEGIVAIQVATGTNHTLVRTNEGKIYAFGYNPEGGLGTGILNEDITIPTLVTGFNGKPLEPSYVAAGQATSFAVANNGEEGYSWGVDNGALGNGKDETGNKNTPTPIKYLDGITLKDLGKIIQISTKTYSTFVLFDSGAIFYVGQKDLGNAWLEEDGPTDYPELIQLPNLEGLVTQISCGEQHTFVTLSDGRAGGIGNNKYGPLGTGNTTDVYSKEKITWLYGGDQKVKQVAAGQWYTLILLDDGSVQFMGNGVHGEGGNGTEDNVYVPTPVLFPTD